MTRTEPTPWCPKTSQAISQRAHTERTASTVLALLADYAVSGRTTYRADSDLFREMWPDANPPGFVLHPYPTMLRNPPFHTVSAIAGLTSQQLIRRFSHIAVSLSRYGTTNATACDLLAESIALATELGARKAA